MYYVFPLMIAAALMSYVSVSLYFRYEPASPPPDERVRIAVILFLLTPVCWWIFYFDIRQRLMVVASASLFSATIITERLLATLLPYVLVALANVGGTLLPFGVGALVSYLSDDYPEYWDLSRVSCDFGRVFARALITYLIVFLLRELAVYFMWRAMMRQGQFTLQDLQVGSCGHHEMQ